MKSKLIISLFCFFVGLCIAQDAEAQRTTNPRSGGNSELETPTGRKIFGNDRWFLGGNVGASFNRGFGYAELSPLLGYEITEDLSFGAGPVYQYLGNNGNNFHTYGVRAMARHNIFNNFFLQGEFANLNVKRSGSDIKCNYRRLPLGAGLRLGSGGGARTFFYGALLYDVLYNTDGGLNSPDSCVSIDDTGRPWVYRLGFAIGI